MTSLNRPERSARVKLTSWSDLVKPDRTVLLAAFAATLLCLVTLHLILRFTDSDQARVDRFGTATAQALAGLAVEPLLSQNRMHLAVLGNRLADLPEVAGVASYSADDRVLASTGGLEGPQYTAPVVIDQSIVGYVRVVLQPRAFRQPHRGRTLAVLAAVLLVPFAVAVCWSVAGAARRGELAALLPRRPRWLEPPAPQRRVQPEDEPALPEADYEPEPAPPVRHFLLAVNLYNQFSLTASQRDFELSLCLELADAVAALYGARVAALPGVGALMDFDPEAGPADDPDRPFQVLCGAFLLARLLRDQAPYGVYRLGLNLAWSPEGEMPALEDEAVSDAALLSALAPETTLAVSSPCARALSEAEGFTTRPLANPLLDELATSDAGCLLATGLEPAADAAVARQAEQVLAQREATSSPSTF